MNTKIRLYFSDKIESDLVARLNKEQSHYIKDVMRLKEGDIFSVFNTQGEWNVSVQNYEKQGTKIKILEKTRDTKPGKVNAALRLGMSPGLIRGVSRFAGIPGLAISTALTAYDQYNKYKNEEGLIYNLFNDKAKAV